MEPSPYHIVIVGGGPAGLAAAVRAARSGLSHVVLERGQLANTVHQYRRGKYVMAEPSSLALHGDMGLEFIAASREHVLAAWERDIERAGVDLRCGRGYEVTRIEGNRGAFRVVTQSGEVFAAAHVVLAIGTGGAPRELGVPGEDLPHVWTHLDDATAHVDKHVVIVGAGDSAIEDAVALSEHDNEVTLIQRREGFDRAKSRNRSAIEAAIKRGEIGQLVGSTVRSVEPDTVVVDSPKGEQTLPCDLLITRLGSRPPRAFLQSLGIEFESSDPEALPYVSDQYESTVPGLYLVGELIGRPLIKHCMNQGYEVVDHIIGRHVTSADEPLLRRIVAPSNLRPEAFASLLRKSVPMARDLSPGQTRALLLDSHVHALRQGDEIYAAGDFSESMFTVIDGLVEVFHEDLDETDEDAMTELAPTSYGQGDFFGEDSLFSGRERTETAIAATHCLLLESSRVAITRLQSSLPELRDTLDRTWARRKIAELFPTLSPAECRSWAEAALVSSFAPGARLFVEGDPVDGLYLIRRGSVIVSRERNGLDQVVGYVAAGEYLGEVGCIEPNARRTASVRASVLTEALRVPAATVRETADKHPSLRATFERRWREQLVRDEHMLERPASTRLLDFVVSKGAKEGTDLLVIDEALCIRCDNCEKACEATHAGISRLDREAGPRYGGIHLPTSCQHCENALCMSDCPADSLHRHPDGEIFIDDTCIGCGNCAGFCTYGVIKMTHLPTVRRPGLLRQILFGARPRPARTGRGHDESAHEVAVKCDLCRDLPQNGAGSGVACVAACPTGAIARVLPSQLIDRVVARQTLRVASEELSTSPGEASSAEGGTLAASQERVRSSLATLRSEGSVSPVEVAAALRSLAKELDDGEPTQRR